MKKEYIALFSGGKDSTAMVFLLIEKKLPLTEIIFVNTTKEFPQVIEHVNKVKTMIPKHIKFTELSFDFDYYFSEHIIKSGKRAGTKGYGFPMSKTRWCTGLKGKTVKKYLKGRSGVLYVGIAYDEKHRVKKPMEYVPNFNFAFPLVDWKITEPEALSYCYRKGFTFGGLYNYFNRLSCWCCPLKNRNELKALYLHFPDLWNKLKEMQTRSSTKFKYYRDVFGFEEQFKKETGKD